MSTNPKETFADHSGANKVGHNGGSNTDSSKAETRASCEHTTTDSGQAMGLGGNTWTSDQSSEGRATDYERLCDMKFSCCARFWPCHHCHNSGSSCGTRELRSQDIKNVKCKRCGKVQLFPKETPHCVECNLKFAEYFCAMCQHLTGTQKHPYHCEKCGICRVHVCLDMNLRDNHKCRAECAHDECYIRFDDAYNGCQILPCSHRVSAMRPNRITNTSLATVYVPSSLNANDEETTEMMYQNPLVQEMFLEILCEYKGITVSL